MFTQLKQIILSLYQAQQIAACKRRAEAIRQRNKSFTATKINDNVWESQFINTRKGVL